MYQLYFLILIAVTNKTPYQQTLGVPPKCTSLCYIAIKLDFEGFWIAGANSNLESWYCDFIDCVPF